MKNPWRCTVGFVLAAAASTGWAAEEKIAGEIATIQGARMEIRAMDGRTVSVRMADDVRISGRSASDLTKLTQGAFVGTTAVPRPDGTLLAREVHIFPESMRGRGEGHRPMEGEAGSTMTNATISRVGGDGAATGSTTTNATVGQVAGAHGGQTMTLAYPGGEKTVFVPDNTPVVMVEPADRSTLVPGAHVVAYASPQPDGSLAATRITVGIKGFVPPL